MYHVFKRNGSWMVTSPRAPEEKHTTFANYSNAVESMEERDALDKVIHGNLQLFGGFILIALIGIVW